DEALRLGDQIAILRDGEVVQQGTSQDIVLRPADDYIASFVKYVNRGRVIRVETVMRRGTGTGPSSVTVPADVTLDVAEGALVGLVWGAGRARFGQSELILETDRFKRSAAPAAATRDAAVAASAQSACAAFGNEPSALIEVLHEVQCRHGDIPEAAVKIIADA